MYIGSSFDEFLEEVGLLAEVEAVAVKRAIASKIAQLMELMNVSKTAMAKRMKTSRAALERLLDPNNGSVTLRTLERAALALGKRLQFELVNFSRPNQNAAAKAKHGSSNRLKRTRRAAV